MNLDKERIVVRINDEDVLELINTYLGNRRKELDVLRQAADSGDFARVSVIGHKMKGSGGGYCLEDISRMGANLELSAKVSDVPSILREIACLQDYLERLEIVGACSC